MRERETECASLIKKPKVDFTRVAVTRQLRGFGCDRYEVGVISALLPKDEAKMRLRTWKPETILKSIGYLKQQNAEGNHIFIRPEGSTGLVFFDDLSISTVKRLEEDGIGPALLIESSPLNYHGWVRVSNTHISAELATAVSKTIAKRYNGDLQSADWRHFGRLSGFTNRKPAYVNEVGQYPFVTLRSSGGRLCEAHTELIKDAEDYIREKQRMDRERLEKIKTAYGTIEDIDIAHAFFQSELRGIEKTFNEFNASKADWMIVNKMLVKGYTVGAIKSAMIEHSVKANRGNINAEQYVENTIINATKKRT